MVPSPRVAGSLLTVLLLPGCTLDFAAAPPAPPRAATASGLIELSAEGVVAAPAALAGEHSFTLESLGSGALVAALSHSGSVAAADGVWALRLDYADLQPGSYVGHYRAWRQADDDTPILDATWEPVVVGPGAENAALLTLLPNHRVDSDGDGFFDHEERREGSDPAAADSLPPDTEPPSFNAELRPPDPMGSATVRLQWSAPAHDRHSDEPALVYEAFAADSADAVLALAQQGEQQRAESDPGDRSLRVDGLAPARAYSFTVVARDEADNRSVPLPPVSLVTPGAEVGVVVDLSGEEPGTELPSPALADLVGAAEVSLITFPGVDAYGGDAALEAGLATEWVELDAAGQAYVEFEGLADGPAELLVVLAEEASGAPLAVAWRTLTLAIGAFNELYITGADFGEDDDDGDGFPNWEEVVAESDPEESTSRPPDNEAPVFEARLQAEPRGTGAIRLQWSAPAVDRHTSELSIVYHVHQWGAEEQSPNLVDEWGETDLVSEPGARSLEVTGLLPGTEYTYTVVAADAAGNGSAPLEEVQVVTGEAAGEIVVDLAAGEPGRPPLQAELRAEVNAVQARLHPEAGGPSLELSTSEVTLGDDGLPAVAALVFGGLHDGPAELLVTLLHQPPHGGPPSALAHAARPAALAAGPNNELLVPGPHFEAHDSDRDGFFDWEELSAGSDPDSPDERPLDQEPPTFAGLQLVAPRGPAALELAWVAASDRHTPSELLHYTVYTSTPAGELGPEALQQPLSGATAMLLSGLPPRERVCLVVRATDAAGNQDTNSAVRCGTPQ